MSTSECQRENLWSRPAGWRDLLVIAIPLILSTGSWSIQHFVDRMFLAWHDPDAMAASMPAGMLALTTICFFMGTASYVNVFIAQYIGAGQERRVGPSLWQGVWFGLAVAVVLPFTGLVAAPAFALAGHTPELQRYETTFFRIHMIGAGFTVLTSAISCFYSGRGRTWPMVWVNVGITAINLVLDYAMIVGRFGCPEMGIAGAAWATVIANGCGTAAYFVMVLRETNEERYAVRSGWRVDWTLMRQLLRFGAPSGLQFMLEVLAFTAFTMLVGRIGTVELAATNIAFQVNTIAFMPMLGFGIAVQTLVGQWLGSDRPDLAARATWSGFSMTFGYMSFCALLYWIVPGVFVDPFLRDPMAADYEQTRATALLILRFVAFYCLFDTMTIIISSALKGAGDTRFVMLAGVILSWTLMVVPATVAVVHFGAGIYAAWFFLTVYVCVVGTVFLGRFLHGKWRSMRVIETPPPLLPTIVPETPTVEVEV